MLKFDEINSIQLYYEPMQISKDDKERRIELAELLTDAFLMFFSTYEVHQKHQSMLTKAIYAQYLADRVSEAVTKVTGIDSYMSDHIKEMSRQVVNTTFEKTEAKDREQSKADLSRTDRIATPYYEPLDSPDSEISNGSPLMDMPDSDSDYWLSFKRAEDIAKSESNTFLNYTDYLDAKNSGKTKKTWLTMLDDKVRETHSEVEGQTIGIDESFTVGDSLMKFPHDLSESPNPREIIGCRCSVEYS